jgi:hypothetical protein
MDALCTAAASDHLLPSLELFESSLKAKSLDEFAAHGLVKLSDTRLNQYQACSFLPWQPSSPTYG